MFQLQMPRGSTSERILQIPPQQRRFLALRTCSTQRVSLLSLFLPLSFSILQPNGRHLLTHVLIVLHADGEQRQDRHLSYLRSRVSSPRICHATLTLIKLPRLSAAVLQCIL